MRPLVVVALHTLVGGRHTVEVRAYAKNECENRYFFVRICCIFTFALPPETQGKPAVRLGHFVGHRGTMACEKGDVSFHGHPNFVFVQFLEMVLPSQLCENSCSWSGSFICATMFASSSLPSQNPFTGCLQRVPTPSLVALCQGFSLKRGTLNHVKSRFTTF